MEFRKISFNSKTLVSIEVTLVIQIPLKRELLRLEIHHLGPTTFKKNALSTVVSIFCVNLSFSK